MKEIIERIINDKIAGTHLFLVETEVKKNRVEVFVDGDCGVNINECAMLNHHLHRQLEAMNIDAGNYVFEISSPGFDRNLSDTRSLKKNVGRKLQIRNTGGKIIKGQLVYVDDNGILLTQNAKGFKPDLIGYKDIKEAKAAI